MALSYGDSSQLMLDTNFRGRIQVACITFCATIMTETPSTVSRQKWASNTSQNPMMVAQQLQPLVVMDASIQAATKPDASDIADSVVQTAVERTVTTYQI